MTPTISLNEASEIAQSLYTISGEVTALPGEIDFNFRIKTETSESYILKISRPNENDNYLEFQQQVLQHLELKNSQNNSPRIIQNKEGNLISEITDAAGNIRKVRLLSWIPGRVWSEVNPQLDELRFSLGKQCGATTNTLQGFEHPEAHRTFDWDIAHSLWTKNHLHLFHSEEKEILSYFQDRFETTQNSYATLRKSVVQNDANDNNIIVSPELINPTVAAIIDFGDAVHTQIINDLAVACAYAIMKHPDPLKAALPIVKGYHSQFPLHEEELLHLYNAIAMRLVISVTKSAINKSKEPENRYLQISENDAWDLLKKWRNVNAEFAHYSFRFACGFSAHPSEALFKKWAVDNTFSFSELFPSENKQAIQLLDLKVSSPWMGSQTEFNDLDLFQFKIDALQKEHSDKLIAGGYCEPRPLYTATSYDKEGNNGPESRTFHLGVDFWLPAGTPVHSLFDGEVVTATNDAGFKEYGGLIILKHHEDGITFYTLYGHLSVASATKYKPGEQIKKGVCIGELGIPQENGNWAPHLHFQIMLSMLDYTIDFPGVTYGKQLPIWKSMCPDPNLLFKNKDLVTQYEKPKKELIDFRKEHLGKALSLSYATPLHIVRGEGVYLMDTEGRKYLDTVNNVNHVGHQHPKVVAAGQRQMSLLNTNTRYLHEEITAYTEALLKKLPKELSVVHIVNSGSEANELAIRMAKACTGQKDMLAIEVGYHGNTNAVMEVSSYKFDGKGGGGKPETTHILPLPDAYRGKYTGETAGSDYANYAKKYIDSLYKEGKGIAGFIGESMVSCGGQIVPPSNYFKVVYQYVKEAGGLCIADEVQTGFGRMGKTFWAFELYNVIPDIVTMGKPAGNGHPLAIVVCTKAVAEKFANGMEFFNTFGGNPVSSAIGRTVLEIIEDEKLQENALEVGEFLKSELKNLQKEFPIIGDVRGEGLFLGFELNDSQKKPLADHASYLANRMKDLGILMSTDGPDYNVLKIKPPLVFSKENAKELIFRLKTVFLEDFMQHY
ncbi:hydroxylysine kinase /5-phosphonooxy-L-lysine phospho-lyase [Ulvibacter sp. MAR_2010_11]|uniref:aminotransferase class III-fold pyridoxal phosphate-dependent enzyme n=1 Tax=Ulvibacter sp. MAR_2010_11 TaxID=1250229 RepID=UPI000C2B5C4B|nr:aminotransferase class III-fold pyridoxal phosphate-dependent enzyme [Ulvibacter sp. MAR_2010_11]PKA82575.1 hydroxylysine kinase /5-phosphonooxy-L-lysine phospho-lyase [Ulvibacter sp. MAR_2010_11]